jgi:hypothetical protein
MGKLYFSKFLDESINRVTIYGKSEKVELINQLAAEAESYFPLVIVTFAMPIENLNEKEVLAVKNLKSIKKSLKDKKGIIYLCKEENDKQLSPYSVDELLELERMLGMDICLFIRLGEPENKINDYKEVLQKSLNICRIDFYEIKQILNSMEPTAKPVKYMTHTDFLFNEFKKRSDLKWPSFKNIKSKYKKYCFIDNVKDLFDENMVLPIARSIVEKGKAKVLYGDIYTYQLKEV